MFRGKGFGETDILDKFIYYRELGYSALAAEVLSRVTYGDENLAEFVRKNQRGNIFSSIAEWMKSQEKEQEEIDYFDGGGYADVRDYIPADMPQMQVAEENVFAKIDKMEAKLLQKNFAGSLQASLQMCCHDDQEVWRDCVLPSEVIEKFSTDSYENIEEKDAKNVLRSPTSTFRMTTSNASMGIIFNQLRNGRRLDVSQIRIEELLNAFDFDARYPASEKFKISTELMPKGNNKEILYINVQAAKEKKAHQNIVLLLDVSGSMGSNDEVTQEAIATIFSKMQAGDTISMVTYSNTDHTVIDGYVIKDETDKERLMGKLMSIEIDGCTYGSAGIVTAYEIGKKHFHEGWNNQVVLITEGDLNFGITEKHGLKDLIEEKKKTGLFLSVIGTGLYNYKDDKLETLAKHGNGTYCVVNDLPDVDEFINKRYISLTTIVAKDVKAQVEFNPKYVKSYRLLGYENRELNHEDFRNDAVISEPYGSGGHGIALYEIERNDGGIDSDLKYVRHEVVDSKELGTIRVNYKDPLGEESHEIEKVFFDEETGVANVKLAYLVYCAAEMLRKSAKMDDDDKVYLWSMSKDSTFRNISGTPGNEVKLACLLNKPQKRKHEF